jgi:DNA-directed RNA polymerase subunit L
MNLKMRASEPNYVEIELVGEDISFANTIKEILIKDSDVEFAACKQEHPQVGHPVIYVRTKKKSPLPLIKDALKEMKKEAADFKASMKEKKKKD